MQETTDREQWAIACATRAERPALGGDSVTILSTDWRLWCCNQATGRDWLMDWGPEKAMREGMERRSELNHDVWLLSPTGDKILPVAPIAQDQPVVTDTWHVMLGKRYVVSPKMWLNRNFFNLCVQRTPGPGTDIETGEQAIRVCQKIMRHAGDDKKLKKSLSVRHIQITDIPIQEYDPANQEAT